MFKYAGTQTEKNPEAAFAGESQARNKYTYFASKAKKEGFEQIAALLRETYGGKIKVFTSEIPHSVRTKEISAEGKSIFAYDPGCGKLLFEAGGASAFSGNHLQAAGKLAKEAPARQTTLIIGRAGQDFSFSCSGFFYCLGKEDFCTSTHSNARWTTPEAGTAHCRSWNPFPAWEGEARLLTLHQR